MHRPCRRNQGVAGGRVAQVERHARRRGRQAHLRQPARPPAGEDHFGPAVGEEAADRGSQPTGRTDHCDDGTLQGARRHGSTLRAPRSLSVTGGPGGQPPDAVGAAPGWTAPRGRGDHSG